MLTLTPTTDSKSNPKHEIQSGFPLTLCAIEIYSLNYILNTLATHIAHCSFSGTTWIGNFTHLCNIKLSFILPTAQKPGFWCKANDEIVHTRFSIAEGVIWEGSQLLPHRTISDYWTIGCCQTVASDVWHPSLIVADSPIAAKVQRPIRPTKEQLCTRWMAAIEQVYSPKVNDKSTDVDDHDDDEYYMRTSCVRWRSVGLFVRLIGW